jgi:hypothetical protein
MNQTAAQPIQRKRRRRKEGPLPAPQEMILPRRPPSHVQEDQPNTSTMREYWTNLRDVSRSIKPLRGSTPEADDQHNEF